MIKASIDVAIILNKVKSLEYVTFRVVPTFQHEVQLDQLQSPDSAVLTISVFPNSISAFILESRSTTKILDVMLNMPP